MELIIIESQPKIDSRILAREFDIEHESLCKSIKLEYPDLKSEKALTNGRASLFYYLNEAQTLMIPVLCRATEKTKAVQRKLIELFQQYRERLNSQEFLAPQNMEEALEFALNQVRENKRLQTDNNKQAVKINELDMCLHIAKTDLKEAEPAIIFHETCSQGEQTFDFDEVARLIQNGEMKKPKEQRKECGRNLLWKDVKERKMVYLDFYSPAEGRSKRAYFPPYAKYKKYLTECLEPGEDSKGEVVHHKIVWTLEGRDWAIKNWNPKKQMELK